MPLVGEAKRKYDRDWIAKRRQEWFSDKYCVQCGSKNDLELDHINPKEKITHKIWSWSKDRREQELEKCQVLCKECHRVKTSLDQFEMFAKVSKTLICANNHDLNLVGWYGYKNRPTQKRCKYCIYLRDAKRRNYNYILSYEDFISQRNQ